MAHFRWVAFFLATLFLMNHKQRCTATTAYNSLAQRSLNGSQTHSLVKDPEEQEEVQEEDEEEADREGDELEVKKDMDAAVNRLSANTASEVEAAADADTTEVDEENAESHAAKKEIAKQEKKEGKKPATEKEVQEISDELVKAIYSLRAVKHKLNTLD